MATLFVRANYGIGGEPDTVFIEEVDNDLSEDELEEIARDLVFNQVDYSWEVKEKE